jgi:replicative DNA helicase
MTPPLDPIHAQEDLELLVIRYVLDSDDVGGLSAEVVATPDHAWTSVSTAAMREAFRSLSIAGEPVSFVTVGHWCKSHGHAADSYLHSMMCESGRIVITSGEYRQAMDRIQEYGRKVGLRKILTRSIEATYGDKPADDIVKDLVTKVSGGDQTLQRTAALDPVLLDHVLEEYAVRIEERRRNVNKVSTGFPVLDQISGGMGPGQFIVLAARPGMGKSAQAELISTHAGNRHGPVLYISFEMGREELAERWTSQRSRTPKRLHSAEDVRLSKGSPIHIYDAGNSLKLLVKRCKRFVKRHPDCSLIVVDQIGCARLDQYNQNRTAVVSEISYELKALAMQLGKPILGLHQIGRGAEKDGRGVKRPNMSDLKDSGTLEEQADQVWLLYRENYYNKEANSDAELEVAKNRAGELGTVNLTWVGYALTYDSRDAVTSKERHEPQMRDTDEDCRTGDPHPLLADIEAEEIPL